MKAIYKWMMAVALVVGGMSFSACEDVDEVPPRDTTVDSNKTYKMPDPVILTAEESAQVDEIRKEYEGSLP